MSCIIINVLTQKRNSSSYPQVPEENHRASLEKVRLRLLNNLVKGVVRRFLPEFPDHILVLIVR